MPQESPLFREGRFNTSDTKFAQQLADLGTQLQAATTSLSAVGTQVAAKPMVLAPTDFFNTAAVQANNPLMLQLAVADVAWQNGLTKAVTMTVGSKDVNGGGDFTAVGNTNTDRPGVSAAMAKAMLGQFLAAFATKYPKGYVIVKGEGGRNNNGGDNPYSLCVIMGPAGAFPSTFLGASNYTDAANFGNPNPALPLTAGSPVPTTQAMVCATAAKLAGVTFGGYPHLADLVKT